MKSQLFNWQKFVLGDLVKIQTGKLDSNAAVDGGIYPFFTCSPVTLSIDNYAFDTEAVLLGGNNAGGVFPIKHYKGKFNAYQRTYILTALDEESLHLRFIYYYLRWVLSDLKKLSVGSATKFLTLQILQPLKIPLPPLPEQRRIAAILDRADAVRRKRQEAIALTEELLRSAFLEMFGDPVTNPKGWEICQLQQFAEIQSGIAKGKKVDPSKAVSVPYMRVANVQDGYLDLTEIKEINVLQADISRYSLKQGDLLLTEGGDPDKLGRGAVWYGAIHPCIHQNHIFCVRPNKDIAEPEYLSSLIGSEYGKRYFLKAAKQTTGIATINKTQLRNFPAFLPPLQLQQKYTQLVLSAQAMREKLKSVDEQTDLFFNSLLQRAFRGEL